MGNKLRFDDASILEALNALNEAALNELPFGVIRLNNEGIVEFYSAWEERHSGLSSERTLGRHFFFDVAPCMNNYLVAERFENEAPLDETIPYVLTYRMRPTPVRLRLLKSPMVSSRWVLIERR